MLNSNRAELEGADKEKIEELFSELALSSLKGFHLITINREACDWALERLQLSNREQAEIAKIKQNYTQNGSLDQVAFCSLRIDLSDKMLIEPSLHQYEIGYSSLLDSEHLNETILLVENIDSDGSFYKLVMDETKKTNLIKNYHLRLANGGGSTAIACFRYEVGRKRSLVCLVDSDKNAPCDSSSISFRHLASESEKSIFIGAVCETVCREVENHIPLNVISDHGLCQNYGHFEIIENLLASQGDVAPNDCLWLYFDIKKGLAHEKITEKNLQPAVTEWIERKYLERGMEFEELNIPGLGSAVLQQFLNSGPAKSAFHRFVRSEYWQDTFSPFFNQVYWFFVAAKPRAAI